MTFKDKGGIHCSFVYQEDARLFVADPASEKICNTNGKFYKIPLKNYNYEFLNQ